MSTEDIIREVFDPRANFDFESIKERLGRMKADELRTLHVSLSDSLPTPTFNDKRYRFVANSESSGLAFPCMSALCRTSSISRTSVFSSLYADEVITFNPLTTFFIPPDLKGSRKRSYVEELSVGVKIVAQMLPLISRGLASFSEFSAERICPDCFAKGLSRAIESENEDHDLIYLIANNYLEQARVTVEELDRSHVLLRVSGIKEFYGHDDIIFRSPNSSKLLDGLSVGDLVPRHVVSDLGMVQRPSTYLVNDLATVAEVSEITGATNALTTIPQMAAARKLFGSEMVSLSSDYTYPLDDIIDPADALRFRDDHWHHLIDLRSFIDDAARSGENIDTRMASEFSKIQHELDRHRSSLNKGLLSDFAVAGATFTTTVATAGFSGIISALIGILGTGHLASKAIPKLVERYSEPHSVKESKVY